MILREKVNGFLRNRSTTSQILTIRRILEVGRTKSLEARLLFVVFSKAFDSIHRGNIAKIFLAYGLHRETVSVIMMLYKTTKVKIFSMDGYTDFFDSVSGVLQEDTLAPFLLIIYLYYVTRTSIDLIKKKLMKENGFSQEKTRSRRNIVRTITDADKAEDIVALATTPTQAETLPHSLEQAVDGIWLHVNADKM